MKTVFLPYFSCWQYYSYINIILQNATQVVNGGKSIEACGKPYFISEAKVRLQLNN